MLKRYLEYAVPVLHMNGKFAPKEYKCSPQTNTDENGVSFAYGYRHIKKNVSLFAIRSKCRNLSQKPYTQGETLTHNDFTTAAKVCSQNWRKWAIYDPICKDFLQQKKYARLWNFACVMVRANNGTWLW